MNLAVSNRKAQKYNEKLLIGAQRFAKHQYEM